MMPRNPMYCVVEKFGDQIGYAMVDFGNNVVHVNRYPADFSTNQQDLVLKVSISV